MLTHLSSQRAQDESPLVCVGRLLDGLLPVLAHQLVVVELLRELLLVRIVSAKRRMRTILTSTICILILGMGTTHVYLSFEWSANEPINWSSQMYQVPNDILIMISHYKAERLFANTH